MYELRCIICAAYFFQKILACSKIMKIQGRHATRVKNPVGQVVLGGDNVSPLVEIGLTDPPKSGGAAAPPASPLVACLSSTSR